MASRSGRGRRELRAERLDDLHDGGPRRNGTGGQAVQPAVRVPRRVVKRAVSVGHVASIRRPYAVRLPWPHDGSSKIKLCGSAERLRLTLADPYYSRRGL